ncbi:helix-turn-helix domain-containing protein [Tenacibaculum maritimum]|uniref:helix-turn-helix domain-containing protein n=1 Tax=Tenacibaculum maritimum TaxID=107401 RepID=UPI0012E50193|nr:helix-turn-helix transcriptional regulator [Tenacibaculum maritimum]CAA0172974.1 putative transcriptional regulator, HTH-XRE family [Tenacibaculum maritimum]CAA0176319.1 Transcriptional regulator [Tenacibaculum maritimum]
MTSKEQIQLDIGKRIRDLREKKGVSQKDLAYSCGFDKSNMARLEMGRTNPTIYTLKKIAENLEIKLTDLVKDL